MKNLIERYLLEEPNPIYAQEIRDLAIQKANTELKNRLEGSLRFGTAGFRAKMEAGYQRMNAVSISKIAYALGQYLKPASMVSIGFDGRHHSEEYALLVAKILGALGHQSFLFPHVIPTPICAFSVHALGAHAGVMITASHNPPQDNGIKIYGPDGAQLVAPATLIIENFLDQAPAYQDIRQSADAPKLVPSSVIDAYFKTLPACPPKLEERRRGVRIVYTPMHGVGAPYALRAFKQAGFKQVTVVKSQEKPDGNFPTVQFPNPEEPGALDEALALAKASHTELILANDPDADRLAVCVNQTVLTGNQIGVLLGNYLIEHHQPSDKTPLVMSTFVSSRMLSKIAQQNQVSYAETLTGFANIAHEAIRREEVFGEVFLFGYEEALGYCIGNQVRDKDGISAAVLFAKLFSDLESSGRSIFEELDRLSLKYGVHRGLSWSYRGELGEILSRAGNLVGFTKQKQAAPGLLVYTGEHDLRLIIRPSGTEPKIKFYAEVVGHVHQESDLPSINAWLDNYLKNLQSEVNKALQG